MRKPEIIFMNRRNSLFCGSFRIARELTRSRKPILSYFIRSKIFFNPLFSMLRSFF